MDTAPHHWASEAFFYHIYPLGFCGAPVRNDFCSAPVARLDQVKEWIPHMRSMGVNALYLGPVFESSVHGYDTVDYYHVDRRLGEDQTLSQLSADLHRNDIRVILDGVFNHVGRDFWAFYDVRQHGPSSPYCNWFQGLRFGSQSPYGDPFVYDGWNGHYDLVKLNLANPEVKTHLFEAVRRWMQSFDIDGLRLDAADCIDIAFLQELRSFTHSLRPDFWLMGEVIHGDYRRWINPATLASVTNYECYKGLYSSHVDKNYFEIAYSLDRQFGPAGMYRGAPLYNFADNHDVNRVASQVGNPAHLVPLYSLLFTMPGIPSIYYGSEWGLAARRTANDDSPLRPYLNLSDVVAHAPQPHLPGVIARLAAIRQGSSALKYGDYRQLYVAPEQFAFTRRSEQEYVLVAVNAASGPARLELALPFPASQATDLLDPGSVFFASNGKLILDPVPPGWARILKLI
ncbi:MAG: alpha-amylase family glycosyl hydrolase [Anaerolineales bacterium]